MMRMAKKVISPQPSDPNTAATISISHDSKSNGSHAEMNMSLPLTPALSPEERENGTPPHSQRTRPTRRTLNDFLPLPGGKGRGEGGREQTEPVR